MRKPPSPMLNRVSKNKLSPVDRAARLRALRAVLRGTMNGLDAQTPKPVTLPYVSIQHVDMEKLP